MGEEDSTAAVTTNLKDATPTGGGGGGPLQKALCVQGVQVAGCRTGLCKLWYLARLLGGTVEAAEGTDGQTMNSYGEFGLEFFKYLVFK